MGFFFKKKIKEIIVVAPVDGEVIYTNKVHDEVFAQDTIGAGVAMIPSNGEFISPITGKITSLFPTNHAYGIETKEGFALLLHIGIDSVKLNGDGFKSFVVKDQNVNVNDKLVNVDLEIFKENNIISQTPIIITNDSLTEHKGKIEIIAKDGETLKRGDPIYKIVLL